jgi:hypothetical protein
VLTVLKSGTLNLLEPSGPVQACNWIALPFSIVCLFFVYIKTLPLVNPSVFMFCWPCISKYACNETILMHYLSSVCWVTTPLQVSGLLVARHHSIPSRPADSQLRHVTHTSCYIYTLLPPDDGLLASLKHVEVLLLNKVKINSASGWFHYMHKSKWFGLLVINQLVDMWIEVVVAYFNIVTQVFAWWKWGNP